MRIITNGHYRESVNWFTATPEQRKLIERDHGDWMDPEEAEFVFYKGLPYPVTDMMRYEGTVTIGGKVWDRTNTVAHGDTHFSGIMARYDETEGAWIMARYIS